MATAASRPCGLPVPAAASARADAVHGVPLGEDLVVESGPGPQRPGPRRAASGLTRPTRRPTRGCADRAAEDGACLRSSPPAVTPNHSVTAPTTSSTAVTSRGPRRRRPRRRPGPGSTRRTGLRRPRSRRPRPSTPRRPRVVRSRPRSHDALDDPEVVLPAGDLPAVQDRHGAGRPGRRASSRSGGPATRSSVE